MEPIGTANVGGRNQSHFRPRGSPAHRCSPLRARGWRREPPISRTAIPQVVSRRLTAVGRSLSPPVISGPGQASAWCRAPASSYSRRAWVEAVQLDGPPTHGPAQAVASEHVVGGAPVDAACSAAPAPMIESPQYSAAVCQNSMSWSGESPRRRPLRPPRHPSTAQAPAGPDPRLFQEGSSWSSCSCDARCSRCCPGASDLPFLPPLPIRFFPVTTNSSRRKRDLRTT